MNNDFAYEEDPSPKEIEEDIIKILFDAERAGIRLPLIELSYPDFYSFSRNADPMLFNPTNSNNHSLIYHSPVGPIKIEPSREVHPRARMFSLPEIEKHPLYKILKGKNNGVRSKDIS